MSQKVNLNAYFERIGFAGSIAPTLATLELLHALHPAAIAFENLNPLLTARVLWNDPDTTQSHHMLLAVDINSSTYIADVGFGGLTMTAPLKLKADTEQTTPHESFRLTGGDPEWLLEAKMGEAWRPLYAFETSEKTMADFEEANRFLANDPASPMRSELRVALAPSGKRLTLKNNRLTTFSKAASR